MMKKAIILIIGLMLLISCNEKREDKMRYTQDSEEINTLKSVIKHYEEEAWEKYRSYYSDTAKIYYNSNEPMTIDAVLEFHKENNAALSSYQFPDDMDEFEMVLTDAEETWVNYWGNWQGTIAENDSTINIPVHITAQFVEGKIVAEHVYFDNLGISRALSEIEKTRMKNQDSISQE